MGIAVLKSMVLNEEMSFPFMSYNSITAASYFSFSPVERKIRSEAGLGYSMSKDALLEMFDTAAGVELYSTAPMQRGDLYNIL